ncbi:MAG: radical SAM protein [Planctomycetes bacterium]|jgi:wyosine [tRNA(Phe)-imidazoG37] synthetase (radical SAM superfamily)|nr:radical SAM protein [Planctomycetota bacterium]
MARHRYVYGPVPSRRLGRSLGVDLVPLKTCTYDCVYCQLGRTARRTLVRREYAPVDEILREVAGKLSAGPAPDYVTVAGSGEPTLHSRIGDVIRGIQAITKVPVAVLTNGSLLSRPEVRAALAGADLVIPSLDAGDERAFRAVNRPHPRIRFPEMVEGLRTFRVEHRGALWLEVLLVGGITDRRETVAKIAGLAKGIRPDRVQLVTVTRPPGRPGIRAAAPEVMEDLRALFDGPVDVFAGPLAGEPAETAPDDAAADAEILDLLRRRPCTASDVARGLRASALAVGKRLDALRARGAVTVTVRDGHSWFEAAGIPPGSDEGPDRSDGPAET